MPELYRLAGSLQQANGIIFDRVYHGKVDVMVDAGYHKAVLSTARPYQHACRLSLRPCVPCFAALIMASTSAAHR